MLTNKKLNPPGVLPLILGLAAVWLAGCSPSGPDALLAGRSLMEKGQYVAAAEKLKLAATLLKTNAQAWNDLGLASHRSGKVEEAVNAYRTALKYDHDLVVVHFNLGCLDLEQGRYDAARNELTAFTVHQGKSFDGWLKLGQADLRLGDLNAADVAFRQALNLNPQSPEVLNNLGLILARRNKTKDAVSYFAAALKIQPNYAPALLNLAVSYQGTPGYKQFALRKYQEYLASQPRPDNWEDINTVARQLEAELYPSAVRSPATNVVIAAVSNSAAVARPVATNPVPAFASSNPASIRPGITNTPVSSGRNMATNVVPFVTNATPPPSRATNPVPALAALTTSTPPAAINRPATTRSVPPLAQATNVIRGTSGAVPVIPVMVTNVSKAATSAPPLLVRSTTIAPNRSNSMVEPASQAVPPISKPVSNSTAFLAIQSPPLPATNRTPMVASVETNAAAVNPILPAVSPPALPPVPSSEELVKAPVFQPTNATPVVPIENHFENIPVVEVPLPTSLPEPPTAVPAFAQQPVAVNTNPPVASANPQPDAPGVKPVAARTNEVAAPAKKGFFSRVNPVNLFHRDPKPELQPTPLPPVKGSNTNLTKSEVVVPVAVTNSPVSASATPVITSNAVVPARSAAPAPLAPPASPRYHYFSPAKPGTGDHVEAERLFALAVEAERIGRKAEALNAFQSATKADPGFFDAQSRLALIAYETGDNLLALDSFETALAINPKSFTARYNFGLALRKAGYIMDAAQEWERVLIINAAEPPGRLAAVHLLLGSLYVEQFHQPPAARSHYQKVLELEPANSQATAIRAWLAQNP